MAHARLHQAEVDWREVPVRVRLHEERSAGLDDGQHGLKAVGGDEDGRVACEGHQFTRAAAVRVPHGFDYPGFIGCP